jgi:cystathionine gamma-synthase
MAAIAAVMELFAPGDHIIASADLYGGSVRLFDNVLQKRGLQLDYVDSSDLPALAAGIRPATKAVFIETPTNPMMQVTDIAGVKEVIGARDILLIVDNTFLTPYFQRPLSLGADVVVHSGTKYLGGHNDTLAGFVISSNSCLMEKLAFIYKTIGACLAPFDSFLLLRGLKTLSLRMERSQASALQLAQWLRVQPQVSKVYYPGLPDHPQYGVSRRQASGVGAMISFEVVSEACAHQVLQRVKIILYAESLGGVESLITYPMVQTHADIAPEIREARGINNRLLRLSVGVENVDDLRLDLEQALSGRELPL